jgi:hypothetical protein
MGLKPHRVELYWDHGPHGTAFGEKYRVKMHYGGCHACVNLSSYYVVVLHPLTERGLQEAVRAVGYAHGVRISDGDVMADAATSGGYAVWRQCKQPDDQSNGRVGG